MIIIIAGVSRSGKTTIAKRLCKDSNFNYIPIDSLISTLEKLYPETGLKHLDDNIEFSPKLAEFLSEFISHIKYEDIDVILDLYQLFPIDHQNILSDTKIPIIYLGYPGMTVKEKLLKIKQHSRSKDWTNNTEDEEMIDIIGFWKTESQIMKRQCSVLNIPFFDTGLDFEDSIKNAENFLKEQFLC